MLKAKNQKPKTFMYGIEITKPWSKEMYDHNERTEEHLKDQILAAFQKTYANMAIPMDEDGLRDMAHEIVGYRYGEGFSIDDMFREAGLYTDIFNLIPVDSAIELLA